MNKLYIVRHGKTDWNTEGRIQGRTDTSLSDEGIEQAELLRSKINIDDINICICSPLIRTKKTAEIITKGQVPIIYDELLMERSFGDYEGKIIEFEMLKQMLDYNLNYSNNNVETMHELFARAKLFLDKINSMYTDKKILIVSHGGFMKALHYNIIGYDENTDFLSFNPQNATVYEYELK